MARLRVKEVAHRGVVYRFPENDPDAYGDAFEALFEECKPLVMRFKARSSRLLPHYEMEDWMQLGQLAMCIALRRWEPRNPVASGRSKSFFDYYWRGLDMRVKAEYTKGNSGYKAVLLNRGIVRRGAEGRVRFADVEAGISLTRMDGIPERCDPDGGRRIDWDAFLAGLTKVERLMVEMIIDGKMAERGRLINLMDGDAVAKAMRRWAWFFGCTWVHSLSHDAIYDMAISAARRLRSNPTLMALVIGA